MKKASLNLSINAIVVLILAITMLGLGLTFMKTMFGKVTNQFGDITAELENEVIKKIESSSSRLEFNKYLIEGKRGGVVNVYYGIYNNLATTTDFTIDAKCNQAIKSGSDPEDITIKTFQAQSIEENKVKVSPLQIVIDSNTLPDTYSCYLDVTYESSTPYQRKEFTVRVN